MNFVICDCSAGDAYIQKTFGSPHSPTWFVEAQIQIPSATYTALASNEQTASFVGVNPGDASTDLVFVTADDTGGGSHLLSSGNKNLWTDQAPSNPVAGPFTADTWHTVVAEYDGTDITWSVDGTTIFHYAVSFTGGPDLAGVVFGGDFSDAVSGEIYWVADVKVGTTLHGTDIFSDDFTGDLSAWTVTGDATISSGGGGATNTDHADAIALTGLCSEGTITNSGATDTAQADDPLFTVYGLSAGFSRQVWWKLTNTTADQAYARFVIKNTTGGPVDIAAALFLDNPAATPIDPNRSVDLVDDWQAPLGGLGTITLGCALEAGATVWLEIGGDDTEGDGDGWDGNIDLTWELLGASFYDTPDAGMKGTTEYRGGLQGATRTNSIPITNSYCKCGDLHFAAIDQSQGVTPGDVIPTDLRVWVWSDGGGAPTEYDLTGTDSTLQSSGPGVSGVGKPLLRTDGEHVWLVCYQILDPNPILCGAGSRNTDPIVQPVILFWTGSGFSQLGVDLASTFGWHDPGGSHYQQVVGELTAAASSAEPGVLHVMWSEAGPHQIDSDTCLVAFFMERVAYSQWSTTGEVAAGDVLQSIATEVTLSSITPIVTQLLFVTNAFGSPVAFYGVPSATDLIGVNIGYGKTLKMFAIDESTGSPTLLQTLDGSTINPSIVALRFATGAVIGGTRLQPQTAFEGADTFFFAAAWTLATPADYAPLLMVPADGSAPITAVPPSITGVGGPVQDVYDDGENVWVGTAAFGLPDAIFSGSLDCATGQSGYVADGDGTRYIAKNGVEFQFDSVADCFYTLGMNSATETSTTEYAPLKIPILRDYLICSVSSCVESVGLHVWERF